MIPTLFCQLLGISWPWSKYKPNPQTHIYTQTVHGKRWSIKLSFHRTSEQQFNDSFNTMLIVCICVRFCVNQLCSNSAFTNCHNNNYLLTYYIWIAYALSLYGLSFKILSCYLVYFRIVVKLHRCRTCYLSLYVIS